MEGEVIEMICPCCGKEMERNAELDKLIGRYEGGEIIDTRHMIELLIKERKVARPVYNPHQN